MSTPFWKIDASHSSVLFSVRHLVISRVRGAFTRWQGTIQFDEEAPLSSKVSVQIEAGSIDTNEPKRDAHLRSTDFLDVERYPTLTFESTRIEPLPRRRYRVSGDLTMHGIVKPVDLDVELLGESKDPWGNERIGFAARATISRLDFGLQWNQVLEGGGLVVGDAIDLEMDVEAVKMELAHKAA